MVTIDRLSLKAGKLNINELSWGFGKMATAYRFLLYTGGLCSRFNCSHFCYISGQFWLRDFIFRIDYYCMLEIIEFLLLHVQLACKHLWRYKSIIKRFIY